MKRGWKIGALAAAGIVTAAASVVAGAAWLGERKLHREVFVKVVPVPFAAGTTVLKQGRYLFETRGCVSCHGPDGSGRVMVNEPGGMHLRAPNITRGPGSVVAEYKEADWVRTIRHGVDPKGRALFGMPSEIYNRLSDADFAALVAYVRSMPPIAGGPAAVRLPLVVKALYGLDMIRDASEKIAHALPPTPPVTAAATAEHGSYVAQVCKGCHGGTLAGGRDAGGPPQGPEPANLTPGAGTAMAHYDTLEKFALMMRTGKRPDGTEVSMPFDALAAFNDTDIAAVYAYLKTLEPKPIGGR